MYHFEIMPPNAKAWVFGSNRLLTNEELAAIDAKGQGFVSNWVSHQQPLKATFDILHGTFLVIMVDESANPVGGCGTDESMRFIKNLEKEYDIKLFDRLQVELMKDNEIIITGKAGATELFNKGGITTETIFFNKNLSVKSEFDKAFKIPFSESWVYKGLLQSTNA